MSPLQNPMIKKPEDLKRMFVNGAIPTESDFADLIDSFVPKDMLPADDVDALRALIAWWRNGGANGTSASPPAPGGTGGGGSSGTAPPPSDGTSGAPNPGAAPAPGGGASPGNGAGPGKAVPSPGVPAGGGSATVVTVAADGKWHPLPVTQQSLGTWTCVASTVNAQPSYRITNHAIAVVGTRQAARRLVQSVDRDSLIPWHTIQFKWQPDSGASYQLNVRSRGAFGKDGKGQPTQIRCEIGRSSSAAQAGQD